MQVTRTKRQIENSNSTLKSWTISIMPTCFHNLIICYASNNTDSPEIHNNRNFDVKKRCTLSIGKHMIQLLEFYFKPQLQVCLILTGVTTRMRKTARMLLQTAICFWSLRNEDSCIWLLSSKADDLIRFPCQIKCISYSCFFLRKCFNIVVLGHNNLIIKM